MGFLLTALDIDNRIGSPDRRYYVAGWFVLFIVCIGTAVVKLLMRIEALECGNGELTQKLDRGTNQLLAQQLVVILREGIHDVANMVVDPNDPQEVQAFDRAFIWLTKLARSHD